MTLEMNVNYRDYIMIRRIKKHFIEATDIMLARPKMVFLMEKELNIATNSG